MASDPVEVTSYVDYISFLIVMVGGGLFENQTKPNQKKGGKNLLKGVSSKAT